MLETPFSCFSDPWIKDQGPSWNSSTYPCQKFKGKNHHIPGGTVEISVNIEDFENVVFSLNGLCKTT